MKFAASYSGGKDSYLSIVKMQEAGHELVALVVSTKPDGKSWTHNLETEYFIKAGNHFGCKVIFTDTDVENYEFKFEEALRKAKSIGAEACVFGDIDNEMHLDWNRTRCKNSEVECVMPLMYMDRSAVIKEFLGLGIKARVVKVNTDYLDESFIGVYLDKDFIDRISKIDGVDICGENGEYHTRVEL